MINFLQKSLNLFRLIKDYFNGNYAYKKYLQSNNCGNKLLSKNDFLRQMRSRMDNKNRCC